jgi:hypothetical protein
MKCPHCDTGIHFTPETKFIFSLSDGRFSKQWSALYQACSECSEPIIFLKRLTIWSASGTVTDATQFLAFPVGGVARPVPAEVPDPYKQDFNEACAVLSISPKASAALSRRNLQAIIHDKAGVKARDLNVEIETLIASRTLPSHISEGLHAVRMIGNFAAHPTKANSTGDIVEVETGEAEWNLDVLESLFDFYFVQPAINAKRKDEINKKLKAAGKPELT